jgi:hypothetical protein
MFSIVMGDDRRTWSSKTIDTRRVVALARLGKSWEKLPADTRLGWLIERGLEILNRKDTRFGLKLRLDEVDNDELLEAIERFVLLGSTVEDPE